MCDTASVGACEVPVAVAAPGSAALAAIPSPNTAATAKYEKPKLDLLSCGGFAPNDFGFGDFTARKDKGCRSALFVSRVALQYGLTWPLSPTGSLAALIVNRGTDPVGARYRWR